MQNNYEIRNSWFAEQIRALEQTGITQVEIAQKLEVKPQYLNAIVNGRQNASEKFTSKFCSIFKINQNTLLVKLFGEPDLLAKKVNALNGKEINVEHIAKKTDSGIPLIGLDVAAGFGTAEFSISDQDIQALYVVPDFSNIDFMIRIKGNSMYPKYSSGDIIACRKIHDSKFIQWNKCYVIATIEQGLLVKRIRQGENLDHLLAVSDNKEYEPFEIPKDEITGIALVVGVIRLE
jgi:phage repressor protein C with HTH and peptisase S24 domain